MDRGYALTWKRRQAETCNGCGTRQSDWVTDPNDPEYVPFVAHHFTCPGCAALEDEKENLDKNGDKVLPGQKTYLLDIELADTVITDN